MQSLRERFASRNIEISLANDSLPIVRLTNPHASAVVSLYGAHIFAYVPRGSRNVLWLSSESNFTPGKPVRGGIPVCWPWFGPGPEEGMPAHGLARISLWNLEKIEENSDGSTTLTLTLDKSAEIGLKASALIRVGSSLSFELTTENFSARPYTLTSALHSYFPISPFPTSHPSAFPDSTAPPLRTRSPVSGFFSRETFFSNPKPTGFSTAPNRPSSFMIPSGSVPFWWRNPVPVPPSSGIPGWKNPGKWQILAIGNIIPCFASKPQTPAPTPGCFSPAHATRLPPELQKCLKRPPPREKNSPGAAAAAGVGGKKTADTLRE